MKSASLVHIKKRDLLLLALAIIGLYIVVPQIGSFRDSLRIVSDAHLGDVAIAFIAVLMTYVSATGTYMLLAFKPLKFSITFIVQFATMFINRLLPGGIGALGASYAYLRNRKHTSSQAVTVVAINNIIGFIGHAVLLLLLIAFFHNSIPKIHTISVHRGTLVALILIIFVVLVLGLSNKNIQNKIRTAFQAVKTQVVSYRKRPFSLVGALGSSMSLTIFNVLSLYFSLIAIGGHLTFVTVFIVFSLGIGLGTATPTPGGLGGFEAGLVAGFVAVNIPPQEALAAALLYRLISYWLALFTGLFAFIYAQRQHYFSLEY